MCRNAGSLNLGSHAAAADVRTRFTRHCLHFARDAGDLRNVLGPGILARVRRVEPINIGQQHERVGHNELRDARCEPVVVAITDFIGGDRVILVDDRDHRTFEETGERAARIQETAPILGIFGCQQNLCRTNAVRAQHLLVGVDQLHLSRGGGGLQVFESCAAFVDAEHRAADRDRARRHDQYLMILLLETCDVMRQCLEPLAIQVTVVIDEQRRTYLDDKSPVAG